MIKIIMVIITSINCIIIIITRSVVEVLKALTELLLVANLLIGYLNI